MYVKRKPFKTPFIFLGNQNGNTILAVLSVTIVIGVFLQTSGFGGLLNNSTVISNSRFKASRDSIVYQIERYTGLPATFRSSLVSNDNPDLRNCLLGTGPTLCSGDGHEYPLNLYTPSTTAQLLAGSGPLGETAHPALYDNQGNLCQTGAATANLTCPFEVFTTFTAKCPAATGSPCAIAESIQVHYVIRTPENLFLNNAGVKNKIVLATVDKMGVEVQTSAILPPPYGYAPNALNSVSLVAMGQGTTTTPPAPPTYTEALAAVLKVVGSTNKSRAKQITQQLYSYYGITDLSLIGAFANFWQINPDAADAAADELSWRQNNVPFYAPTAADVNNIAATVALYPNPVNAIALAYGLVGDITQAQSIVGMLANITDVFHAKIIVDVKITSAAVAEAVSASLTGSGITNCENDCSLVYLIAETAKNYELTDPATLKNSVSIIVNSQISETDVRRQILVEGITDAAVALQMQEKYISELEPVDYSSSEETTTTADNTSDTTPATPSSPTSVNLISACTNSSSCGTTIGM